MKKIAQAVLIIVAILIGGFFGLIIGVRYLFLGQLSATTSADFVKIEQKNQYIAQAPYDFKAEHGLWPQQLADLTPNYLTSVPSNLLLQNQDPMIPTPFAHIGVTYSFWKGHNYHNDNLDVFKAAAEPQQGHFDDAAVDLDRVIRKGNTGSLWAHHLDQLHQAIISKDRGFVYDAGGDAGRLDDAAAAGLILVCHYWG
jgi:hypothetical protein